MKRFWGNKQGIKYIAILCVVMQSLLSGCVKSNIYFGNEMVPKGWRMETHLDTIDMVKTYQISVDSFPSILAGSGAIGLWRSDSIGECKASMVTNYVPVGFENDTFFGNDAGIDSMKLTMALQTINGLGDSTISMKIQIHRINGHTFVPGTNYYSNFPIEKYLDPTPLATVTTNSSYGDTVITAKLPKWYAELHFDNRRDSSNIYVRDEKFINRINGLYFTAEPVNKKDRRVLSMDLSSCNLRLYYHNSDYPDSLLVQSYILYNQTASTITTCFQKIERDYTKTNPNIGGLDCSVINDTIEPQEKVYIASPGGLSARIQFDTTQIERMRQHAQELGYKKIAVMRAELRLHLIDKDYKTQNRSISTLKVYLDINKPMFITEYNPIMISATSSSTSSGETNSYDTVEGSLFRSGGYYVCNLSGFVQRLISKATNRTYVDIYPAWGSISSWGDTYIGGSEHPQLKPELIITYTLTD